jgi:hypothetical protein
MRRFAFQAQGSIGDAEDSVTFAPGRLPLSRAKKAQRLFWRLIIAASGVFCVAYMLALRHAGEATSSSDTSPTPPAPLPAWIEVANPTELFRLATPDFAKQGKIYRVRRHRTGGGEQDILALGDLNGPGPFARFFIYRLGEESATPAAFFVDLARRAAETGRAITFAAQPTALATRLGTFEAAELNLTRQGSAAQPCLGFRLAAPANLRLTGFACDGGSGADRTLRSRAKLACLLDALELAPSVNDKDFVAFFAARELNADTACDGTPEAR